MVTRRRGHVVRHDVDKIHIGHYCRKIDVVAVPHCGQSQQRTSRQLFAQLLHEQCEVFSVVGRRGYAGSVAGGIFPVNVDAVEIIFPHHSFAVLGKFYTQLGVGRHLAESTASPASDRKLHLQPGIVLLERGYAAQALGVGYPNAVECLSDVSESIVDIGHQGGIRHILAPGCDICDNSVLRSNVSGGTECRQHQYEQK